MYTNMRFQVNKFKKVKNSDKFVKKVKKSDELVKNIKKRNIF